MNVRAAIPGLALAIFAGAAVCETVWPAPPAEPRVRHARSLDCGDWKRATGFWGRIAGLLGGDDPADVITLPLDVLADGERLFLTCQEVPGLVEVEIASGKYRLHECGDAPFDSPVGLARAGDDIIVADSGTAILYRFRDGEVRPLVTEGLVRPTGVAYLAAVGRICVVDTGAHRVVVYDTEGNEVESFGTRGDGGEGMNFPTFAGVKQGRLLVNDTLNCRIVEFGPDGEWLGSFGMAGDRPGAFARPKGLATDDQDRTWVADAVFDNVQVFDAEGRVLLVIGSRGTEPGQFWSPSGIAVDGNLVYVADTFNNRIQVLEILEDDS